MVGHGIDRINQPSRYMGGGGSYGIGTGIQVLLAVGAYLYMRAKVWLATQYRQ